MRRMAAIASTTTPFMLAFHRTKTPPPAFHRDIPPAAAARVRMSAAADGIAVTNDADSATKTVNVIIKGKVQGVFYRNWTVDSARELGVNGWVRNLRDGSVEAVFAGTARLVDSLVNKCHGGPSAARVTSVEVKPWKDDVPQGFERKPTIW